MGEKPKELAAFKSRAKKLKGEIYTLYLAYCDPRTPWYAKLLVILVVAYAISPIDLIPDFIPILGYLDDLILVPLGISLALKIIPKEVIEDCRAKAAADLRVKSKAGWIATGIIITIWLLVAVWIFHIIRQARAMVK